MSYVKNAIKEAQELSQRFTGLAASMLVARIKEGVPPEKIDDGEMVFVFKGLPEDVIRGILRISCGSEEIIAKVIALFPEIEEELNIRDSSIYIDFIYTDEFRSEVTDVAIVFHVPLLIDDPLLMERVECDSSQITGDEDEGVVTTSMSINVQTDKDGTLASLLAARASSTYSS